MKLYSYYTDIRFFREEEGERNGIIILFVFDMKNKEKMVE